MDVDFLSKQSLETKPPQFYKVSPLKLVTIVIVINIVIGGFSREDMSLSDYRQRSNYIVPLQLYQKDSVRAKLFT